MFLCLCLCFSLSLFIPLHWVHIIVLIYTILVLSPPNIIIILSLHPLRTRTKSLSPLHSRVLAFFHTLSYALLKLRRPLVYSHFTIAFVNHYPLVLLFGFGPPQQEEILLYYKNIGGNISNNDDMSRGYVLFALWRVRRKYYVNNW